MRFAQRVLLSVCLLAALAAAAPPPAAAQFGIGARMAVVRADTELEDDSVRFFGGQIRLGIGQRSAVEISLDRKTETFELLNERVRETPIQASLLLYLAAGSFKPYVLGGPGWYSRTVESLDEVVEESVTTREFGWHAGFGAEFRMGNHAGVHADYRYTFLSFDDDDDPAAAPATGTNSLITGLLPSHSGSMWTVGVTIYF